MRPFFVANSTRGIAVIVSLHGSSTPIGTTNASVAAGSSLCKAVTGGRQCTISAGAPPGSDDFTIKTYDAQPSGSGFSGAKQLAVGMSTKSIGAGKKNSLNVTVGGVVARGTMVLATSSLPVIESGSQTVTMGALDADGNTIVNDGWYDAAGKAVTMALAPTHANLFHFSPATVSFASPKSTMTYNAGVTTPTQVQNGFSELVWASPSNGTPHGIATLTLTKPAIVEFPLNNGNSLPEGIAVGPDNAIWFAENGDSGNAIGRIVTSAAANSNPTDYSSGMTASAGPTGLAVAPDDGKIWFTEFNLGKIASIDPSSHAIHEYATAGGSMSAPAGITAGPDGKMWFTESYGSVSKIGRFNATAVDSGYVSSIVDFDVKAGTSGPYWIAAGPDNQLWFTEGNDYIGTITTNGTSPNAYALAGNSILNGQITTGPDGALWFTEQNPNAGYSIGRSTTGGSITLPHTFSNKFTEPTGIVTGPDGDLWFAEYCNDAIGRFDPTNKTLVEFTLPHTTSYPWGIVKGPDGALWFTESFGNRIGKLK